jgi:subtilisin family serine protease
MRYLARSREVMRATLLGETAPAVLPIGPFIDIAGKFGRVIPDEYFGAVAIEVNDETLPAWTVVLPGLERAYDAEIVPARRMQSITPPTDPAPTIPGSLMRLALSEVWGLNVRGTNVDVGVIDFGFAAHDSLKNVVKSHHHYDAKAKVFKPNGAPGNKNLKHGTFAAALIAGAPINGHDISVAPEARLHLVEMPVEHFEDDLSKAIRFLVEKQNCRVLSISLGTWEPAPFLDVPLKKARNSGALTVAAIGNDGKGIAMWPGACRNVLSVGFCDDRGDLPTKSGSTHLERAYHPVVPLVVAPGIMLVSAEVGGSSCQFSGSSFAAPLVAGLAALLRSDCPTAMPDEIEEAILTTCERLPHYDERCGYGIPSGIEALKLLRVLTMC